MAKGKWGWLMVLLLPFLLGSCNDSDDVQKIFTGKTWRMTYIVKKNEYSWYKFPGVDEKILDSYNPLTGTRYFKVEFTGSTENDIISGDFVGSGAVVMNGTWQANGVDNTFSTRVKSSSVKDSKDTLGKFIIEAMTKATLYTGDEHNLYLYFEYNAETLCIVFTPDK